MNKTSITHQRLGATCAAVLLSILCPAFTAAVAAETLKVTGTVKPADEVNVSARVTSTVVRFGPDRDNPKKPVDYRSVVSKGDVLAELDAADFEAELESARLDERFARAGLAAAIAKQKVAELELDRAAKAGADQPAGTRELAEAKLRVAESDVELNRVYVDRNAASVRKAERRLAACVIRSPIDGVVIDRRCQVGDAVGPDVDPGTIFLIADLTKLTVWIDIEEADIAKVAVGQRAEVTTSVYPGVKFTGRLAQVRLNAIHLKGRTVFPGIIDLDPNEHKLLPYLTADVSIDAGK